MAIEEELREYCQEVKEELAKTDFPEETKEKVTRFLVSQKELELSNTITEVIVSEKERRRGLDLARKAVSGL